MAATMPAVFVSSGGTTRPGMLSIFVIVVVIDVIITVGVVASLSFSTTTSLRTLTFRSIVMMMAVPSFAALFRGTRTRRGRLG